VHPIKVALKPKGGGGGRERSMDVHSDWMPGEPVLHAVVGATPMAVQITRDSGSYKMIHRGASVKALVMRPREAELKKIMPKKTAADTSKFLLCPMPGLVVSINVEIGQEVKSGETLAVVEAMKMENVLRAERDGRISKINAKKGDSLAVDAVILEFA
jgi:propionyl-CoA carboxylase alpha chain